MKIVLIGNYRKDKQESMVRFSSMLSNGLSNENCIVEVYIPPLIFGSLVNTTLSGVGKWLGYIDKWITFPVLLSFKRFISSKDTRFHICDHSNAPYLSFLPKTRTSITCHDVLAIRGALGYEDAYCPAGSTGKLYQKWIATNLLKAQKIAAVSDLTLRHLIELNSGKPLNNWRVILNGFNANFSRLSSIESDFLFINSGLPRLATEPFILHVGSNLPRKNRKILVELLDIIKNDWNGNVCYAGQPIGDDIKRLIHEKQLQNRIIEVVKPNHQLLTALFSKAEVFIFPSHSEGFGWPVIEAQACGTPVIASSVQPMPEVGGQRALYADPNEVNEFKSAFKEFNIPDRKISILAAASENIKRFDTKIMIKQYLEMFKS